MTLSRRELVASLAALGALSAGPALALPEPKSAAIERDYVDGAFGQVHLRIGTPKDRSAAARPPLILLHQSPLSGRMFDRLLPLLATHRRVIAVDTPGYGESDRPLERPALPAYGDAILGALAARFGTRVDVMGYHTGAALAVNMAARRPRNVRRLVLISVPYFDEQRRSALLAQLAQKAPYKPDGSHLLPAWTGTFSVRPAGQSIDDVARIVAEKQRVGQFGEWALVSAMESDMGKDLRRIRQPCLILAPHDGLEEESGAAARMVPGARLEELPALAYGLFDAAPDLIAGRMLAFL